MDFKKGDVVRFKGSDVAAVIDAILQDIDTKEIMLFVIITTYSGITRVMAQPHVVEKLKDRI